MNTKYHLKRRKAGSQILAAAILMGIAISAAGVYASGIMDQISVTTQNSRISVQHVGIIQDDNENEWFAATIKNEGSVVIDQINITIQIDNITVKYYITDNVKPGRSVIQELVQILGDGNSPAVSIGESVPVEFRAISLDGSIFSKIESVRIS
ncbi:MAG: hypothetical protein K8823_165 [Cenarchaeum symbiont of Oopsacas minuta]|nr:hypothetical protein [Cenarchaeum symbiont of Oopsacas minuta]